MWHWGHRRKKKSKKSVFGSEVKSQEEIRKLSKKIKTHEKKEFEDFEKGFEALWKDVEK